MDNSSVSSMDSYDSDDDDNDGLTWHMRKYGPGITAVFWDVEDCQIPNGSNAVEVSQNIRLALKKMKYSGGASIYAYGNTEKIVDGLEPNSIVVNHLPRGEEYDENDKFMDYSGTASIYADKTHVPLKLVNHLPAGVGYKYNASIDVDKSPAIVVNHLAAGEFPELGDKHVRLQKILVNMFTWTNDHPPPANMMLILGDITEFPKFISAIHRFRLKDYDVLFAQPENKSAPPNFPVSTKCLWEKLSVGEIHIVQTNPVDNTFKGSRRKSPNMLFLLAGALVCFAFARLRPRSSN